MNLQEQLNTYADLIIQHGANVQKGQDVTIVSELIHRDFVNLLVEKAYNKGARYVHIDLFDPLHARTRILESKSVDYLTHVPDWIPLKFEQMLPESGAYIRILGSEDPDILSDLDPEKVNKMQLASRKKMKRFYDEGIGHSKIQWTIAAAATPAWGLKVFPELNSADANEMLWNDILRICRADDRECLTLWKNHNDALHRRAKKLTDMKISTLHFVGPGTDLKVGLSDRANFRGGSDKSPRNVDFEPNLPTEEVFTTPDCRKTSGKVTTTRPFLINGKMIRGLILEFENGAITKFEAAEGKETFAEYINSDPGAKMLGEVALVGIDSPIFQTGRVYEEILFDENAACHIAVGFAYRFCLEGYQSMTQEEFVEHGCNTSHVHTDMMISSEEVDVIAECSNGETKTIIEKGEWVLGI